MTYTIGDAFDFGDSEINKSILAWLAPYTKNEAGINRLKAQEANDLIPLSMASVASRLWILTYLSPGEKADKPDPQTFHIIEVPFTVSGPTLLSIFIPAAVGRPLLPIEKQKKSTPKKRKKRYRGSNQEKPDEKDANAVKQKFKEHLENGTLQLELSCEIPGTENKEKTKKVHELLLNQFVKYLQVQDTKAVDTFLPWLRITVICVGRRKVIDDFFQRKGNSTLQKNAMKIAKKALYSVSLRCGADEEVKGMNQANPSLVLANKPNELESGMKELSLLDMPANRVMSYAGGEYLDKFKRFIHGMIRNHNHQLNLLHLGFTLDAYDHIFSKDTLLQAFIDVFSNLNFNILIETITLAVTVKGEDSIDSAMDLPDHGDNPNLRYHPNLAFMKKINIKFPDEQYAVIPAPLISDSILDLPTDDVDMADVADILMSM